MWECAGMFARDYAEQMNKAIRNDDWAEVSALYLEAKRIQRELGNIVKAFETMRRYDITVG